MTFNKNNTVFLFVLIEVVSYEWCLNNNVHDSAKLMQKMLKRTLQFYLIHIVSVILSILKSSCHIPEKEYLAYIDQWLMLRTDKKIFIKRKRI